jgi:starch synthase
MKNNKLKILIAASEVAPLAKVGGLGDVVGALPKALNKFNLDARIIMPFYGIIDKNKYKIKLIKQNIKIGTESVNLWQTTLPDSTVPVYLIEHILFKNRKIYSTTIADGQKDIEKFVLFSQAILESTKAINFTPNIIHLNDWHVATVATLLKTNYKTDKFFKSTKTLYTIHNLANQGITKTKNCMAEGIINANLINTVSQTYAKEILTKEYGAGLEKKLTSRKNNLYGILNGIDTDFFNPTNDNLINQKYSLKNLDKKTNNKLILQKQLNLPEDKNKALVGLVTRFVGQKGVELITKNFSKLNCQFVFLGTGEKKYEDALLSLAKKYPNNFKAIIKFDEKLAHLIYAGSDIFLVPSRFEPCGLTQMIAMRYGAVPIVRETGGLKDTVTPLIKSLSRVCQGRARGIKPTGFTFKKFDSNEFYKTLEKALNIYYKQPKIWRQLQLNGMKQNFSWDKSAKEYLTLYKKLLKI